tara:strand:- start:926 stop:1249 length:324 start_codon:yes stop_codon:yes gene_type:complete
MLKKIIETISQYFSESFNLETFAKENFILLPISKAKQKTQTHQNMLVKEPLMHFLLQSYTIEDVCNLCNEHMPDYKFIQADKFSIKIIGLHKSNQTNTVGNTSQSAL